MLWVVAAILLVWQVGVGILVLRSAAKRRREGEARWRWMPSAIDGWARFPFGLALAGGLAVTPWLFLAALALAAARLVLVGVLPRVLGARRAVPPGKPFAGSPP